NSHFSPIMSFTEIRIAIVTYFACLCFNSVNVFLSASNSCEDAEEISEEFSQFDFERIRDATNDFSDANKLGQGGFGAVYKVLKERLPYENRYQFDLCILK
ncbi:Tyrosine-protein kinase, partial [Trema orientale]